MSAALVTSFLLSAGVVIVAGTYLAKSGDVIAARSDLGGVWVGSVFLALATSLPEIATDVAAVRHGAPDLAAGDLFGSSMANMFILGVLALLPRGADLFRRADLEHALYAAIAIVLTSTAAILLLLRSTQQSFGVGHGSLLLLLIYAVGSRAAYRHGALARSAIRATEMAGPAQLHEGATIERRVPSLRRAVVLFVAASAAILLAAPQFARSAEHLAIVTGVGTTFVGTWLVGLSTSLPELVTSVAAVRAGAFDLAVGNLFGSNAFNMTTFAVLDLAARDAPVLGVVSPAHAVSAAVAVALMAVGVAALVHRATGRGRMLEPGGAMLVCGYVLGLLAVLLASRSG
jgi:cation:H+ antiporter